MGRSSFLRTGSRRGQKLWNKNSASEASGSGWYCQKDNKYKSYGSPWLKWAGESHLQQGKYTPHRIWNHFTRDKLDRFAQPRSQLINMHGRLDLKEEYSLSNERLDTGVTETDNITFVWRIQITKQGIIEVLGCGCGRAINIDQTLETLTIFKTSMNTHNSCLVNETETRPSCLVLYITLLKDRKTSKLMISYYRKTLLPKRRICSCINLIKNKSETRITSLKHFG